MNENTRQVLVEELRSRRSMLGRYELELEVNMNEARRIERNIKSVTEHIQQIAEDLGETPTL